MFLTLTEESNTGYTLLDPSIYLVMVCQITIALCNKPLKTQLLPSLSNPQDPQNFCWKDAWTVNHEWNDKCRLQKHSSNRNLHYPQSMEIHQKNLQPEWEPIPKEDAWCLDPQQHCSEKQGQPQICCRHTFIKTLYFIFIKTESSANGHWLQEMMKSGMHKLMSAPPKPTQQTEHYIQRTLLTNTITTTKYLQPKVALTDETTYSSKNDIHEEFQSTANHNEMSNPSNWHQP